LEASDADLEQTAAVKLSLDAFGVNVGYGAKRIFVNGSHIGNLPPCGDQWTPFSFNVPLVANTTTPRKWSVVIRCANNEDKFKVGHMTLTLVLRSGREIALRSKVVATSHQDWAFFEGITFTQEPTTKLLSTPVIELEFARTVATQGSSSGKG